MQYVEPSCYVSQLRKCRAVLFTLQRLRTGTDGHSSQGNDRRSIALAAWPESK